MEQNHLKQIQRGNKKLYAIDSLDKFQDSIQIIKFIANGTFGMIQRAIYKQKKILAIKTMPTTPQRLPILYEQLQQLKEISHPNIISTYFGFHHNSPLEGTKFIIGMEYAKQNLSSYIEKRGQFTQKEVVDLAKQLAEALYELQCRGVAHRDLKPDNILIDELGCYKLCDFSELKINPTENQTINQTVTGTPLYLSPELRNAADSKSYDKIYNAFKSDAFSYALILLKCSLGIADSLLKDLNMLKGKSEINFILANNQTKFDPKILLILEKCLDFNYKERYDFKDIKDILSDKQITKKIQSKEKILVFEVINFSNGKYEGEVLNNQMHGHGIFYYVNGDKYDGQ